MGDGMPGNVARGATFDQLDQRMNGERTRRQMLENLRTHPSLAEAMAAAAGQPLAFDRDQQAHVNAHWLGESWFGADPEGRRSQTLRVALIRALEEAVHRNVPVRTYWICPGAEEFSAAVLSSPHQVTLLLLTPRSAGAGDDFAEVDLPDQEDIWLLGTSGQLRDALAAVSLGAGGSVVVDVGDADMAAQADGDPDPGHRDADGLRYRRSPEAGATPYGVISVRMRSVRASATPSQSRSEVPAAVAARMRRSAARVPLHQC